MKLKYDSFLSRTHLKGTPLTPWAQMALLRRVSILTSLVPICFSANFLISCRQILNYRRFKMLFSITGCREKQKGESRTRLKKLKARFASNRLTPQNNLNDTDWLFFPSYFCLPRKAIPARRQNVLPWQLLAPCTWSRCRAASCEGWWCTPWSPPPPWWRPFHV